MASKRKLRLFAVACCRRIWHLIGDEQCREAVRVAERYADGQAGWDELTFAHQTSRNACDAAYALYSQVGESSYEAAYQASAAAFFSAYAEGDFGEAGAASETVDCAADAASTATSNYDDQIFYATKAAENAALCRLLRDIFGNPFHPVTIDPSWLAWKDRAVVKLAQTIYDERHFDDMLILADVLEVAGCDNADLLAHCRHSAVHVRGCWVVDLILSKDR